MSAHSEDARAIERSLHEPEAFAAVYRRHAGTILRYTRSRLGTDAAEDAAHEVFVRAFRQRRTYEPRSATAMPWLYGIAANVIADLYRKEARHLRALERMVWDRVDDAAPEGAGPRRPLTPELVEALLALSPEERETLLLAVWGELSYDEIATALSIPSGTVRSRVSRARARLQAALGRPETSPAQENGEAHA